MILHATYKIRHSSLHKRAQPPSTLMSTLHQCVKVSLLNKVVELEDVNIASHSQGVNSHA